MQPGLKDPQVRPEPPNIGSPHWHYSNLRVVWLELSVFNGCDNSIMQLLRFEPENIFVLEKAVEYCGKTVSR